MEKDKYYQVMFTPSLNQVGEPIRWEVWQLTDVYEREKRYTFRKPGFCVIIPEGDLSIRVKEL